MKIKFTLISLILFSFLTNAQADWFNQVLLEKDANGHFKGDLKVSGVMNRGTIDAADKNGFLKEYTLSINVWDYYGEPMEVYGVQWARNSSYEVIIENTPRSITLNQLEEYPDLKKRFLDIRPTKFSVKIAGIAGDGTAVTGSSVGLVSIEEAVTPVQVYFNYIVKDDDLLIAREGLMRSPTIAGSPPTWNEFFNWSYDDPTGPKIHLNISEENFKDLPRETKKKRIKKIKDIWKQIEKIAINAEIETLEWPELEMIDIIKTYDRYKKKEVSPQEKLEAELAKVQRTTAYTKNDGWGELPQIKDTTKGKSLPEITVSLSASVFGDNYFTQNSFKYAETSEELDIVEEVYDALVEIYERYGVNPVFYTKLMKPIHVLNNRFLIYELAISDHEKDDFAVYDLQEHRIINQENAPRHNPNHIGEVKPNGELANLTTIEMEGFTKITSSSIYTDKTFQESRDVIEKNFQKGEKYYLFEYQNSYNDYDYYDIFDENFQFIKTLYVYKKLIYYLVKETPITREEIIAHRRKFK
ncbi:hypothetical protein [Ulvibacter litoralis]|uniref:DUF3857 domain-containing protein n=1 Tax=Ulvibacter litoralis TaxID=227084 RepID=A0A1G7H0I6_9FLAO|nr:hypothetical protein [Ulvibacter litoralis]GHC59381.1 hypothetical protein GCM10008083_25280 [Ulvibacter litoralis]SDE93865.1 hypothetical protein SAMN05421855_103444 [Ulvibacter litoralis]